MTDPFATLGLRRTATPADVRAARRDLAKQHHPDTGGDPARMREINAAAGAALQLLAAPVVPALQPHDVHEPREPTGVARDVPSFTVEALPVETFEALLVVTSWIGEVLDDEPPYRLDTHLYQPAPCWCRLELVPDAGASTVSITLAGDGEHPVPVIEAVRDTWVDNLNRYDWA